MLGLMVFEDPNPQRWQSKEIMQAKEKVYEQV